MEYTLEDFIKAIQNNIPNVKIGVPYPYNYAIDTIDQSNKHFNNLLQDDDFKVIGFFGGSFTYSVINPVGDNNLEALIKSDGTNECNILYVYSNNRYTGTVGNCLITRIQLTSPDKGNSSMSLNGWIIPVKLP